MVGDERQIDEMMPQVEALVGSRAAVARNLPTDLTITCLDASKGHAAKRLAVALGIEGSIVAVGDSGNDISMLKVVDIGVAMSNARPETKEAAEFVTQGSNSNSEKPGVLEVVQAVLDSRQP